MMGPRQEAQPALFYEFSLEDHVPQNHLLRSIDRFVDLSEIRTYLADFYSPTGRPSMSSKAPLNARLKTLSDAWKICRFQRCGLDLKRKRLVIALVDR